MREQAESQPRGFLAYADRILSRSDEGRFDRWVEFLSAIVLSLATVLTAWCGYQATIWDGQRAAAANEATAARVQAAQQTNQAMLRASTHVGLFVEFAAAISEDNEPLSNFLLQRFPAPLRVATDAWLARNPLSNPDAPATPFDMPEYQLDEQASALALEQLAAEKSREANHADELSDGYVLLTVIFAMVLFFGGISGKFQWQIIDAFMLVLGLLVMAIGLWLLLRYPVGYAFVHTVVL